MRAVNPARIENRVCRFISAQVGSDTTSNEASNYPYSFRQLSNLAKSGLVGCDNNSERFPPVKGLFTFRVDWLTECKLV